MDALFPILFVCYAVYAYNRRGVTFCVPSLIEQGLDPVHAGLILSSQTVAFSIGKLIAGVVSDRVNPAVLFTVGIAGSGVSTLLFSISDSVLVFASLWFLNGLSQGCGWPAIAKILRQRAPPNQFGTYWSLLSSATNFSGSISPFLSAYIILNYGWRWSLLLSGFSSLSMALIYIPLHFFSSNKSTEAHKSSTKKSDKKDLQESRESIADLLHDPFLMLISFCFMVVLCTKHTVSDWGQMYLLKQRGHSQYTASAFTSSVEIGGFLGKIASGLVTDIIIKQRMKSVQSASVISGDRLKVALGLAILNLAGLHAFRTAITEASSMTAVTLIGFMIGMTTYGPIAIYGIVASESAPPHLSGTSHAIAALAGNVGATISGLPFSYIAKHYNWSSLFLLLEVITLVLILVLYLFRNVSPFINKKKIN